jgi:hypothetical protein
VTRKYRLKIAFGNGKECPIRSKRERVRLNNPPQQNWSELGQNDPNHEIETGLQ